MGCFTVRDHSTESFHGSNSGNCLIAELHVLAHKIKDLFITTNGHHLQSSQEQAGNVNASSTNEIEVNSVTSRVHPTGGSENQTPEQNQSRDATREGVAICTMSKEYVLQTQTYVSSETNKASDTMSCVLTQQLLKTKSESYLNEECPTCLEEYEPENPKIVTKCSHHFHLSCIYAWMERSDRCPICLRVMEFDENE